MTKDQAAPTGITGKLLHAVATVMKEFVAREIKVSEEHLGARIAAAERRIAELETEAKKPHVRFLGVHTADKEYSPGDAVTAAGSLWIALGTTTSRPGDGTPESSRGWRLAVKRGDAAR